MSDQFTPQEQFLVERLRRAPQAELNSAVFEVIRVRVLDAMDALPLPVPQPALPSQIIALVIALVVLAAIIVMVIVQRNESVPNSSTPVLTASPLIAPSATPSLTETPTVTVTSTLAPTAIPTIENITVIEGAVESIDGNIITIFAVEVQIDASDPLLNTIQIGDVIRVEGNTQTTANGITVIATTVTYVNVDVNVAPPSGEVWQDDGSCLNPPPDWAPAHGWRRRCQGEAKDKGKDGMGDNGGDD